MYPDGGEKRTVAFRPFAGGLSENFRNVRLIGSWLKSVSDSWWGDFSRVRHITPPSSFGAKLVKVTTRLLSVTFGRGRHAQHCTLHTDKLRHLIADTCMDKGASKAKRQLLTSILVY